MMVDYLAADLAAYWAAEKVEHLAAVSADARDESLAVSKVA